MLDAYIIDRIRREQERQQRENARLPLYIDEHPPPPDRPRGPRDDSEGESEERGSVVIDFSV